MHPARQRRVLPNFNLCSMKQHDGKRPGLFDAAFLTTRYKSEFAMVTCRSPCERL